MEKRDLIAILIILVIGILFIQQPTGMTISTFKEQSIEYLESGDTNEDRGNQIQVDPSRMYPTDQSPQPQQTEFRACPQPQMLPLTMPQNTLIHNVDLAIRNSHGGTSAESFVSFFTTPPGYGEYHVYGSGSDQQFLTPDDTGDRIVQALTPTTPWFANNYYVAAFGDTIMYIMTQSSGGGPPHYIFIKKAGLDGLLGTFSPRPSDDIVYVAGVTPTNTQIQRFGIPGSSGTPFDIVPNGIVFGLVTTLDNRFHVVHQDFVDGIPGNGNDVYTIMGSLSATPGVGFGSLQTSSTKTTSWHGPVPGYPNDIGTWVVGPNPTGGLYSHFVGAGGTNEKEPKLSYDGSFLITIFESPSNIPPPQGTAVVNLYNLRQGLQLPPRSMGITLPTPSGLPASAIGPFIEIADVDATISGTGSLAALYRFYDPVTFQSHWYLYYRNTGADRNFDNNDYTRTCFVSRNGYGFDDMKLKEKTVALLGTVNSYGIHVLQNI